MGFFPPRRAPTRGFTLIELIIVVLVIGVLATLLMPRYRQSVLRAQGAEVATRVEQINVALKLYETDHDSIPSGSGPVGAPPPWLVIYLTHNHFLGPAGITWQFAKTSGSAQGTLVLTAGTPDEQQILLAADGALGSISATLGGGNGLLVTLAE
jgi:prepilin-type N-terminal cleavage/methylation domain-containing protein